MQVLEYVKTQNYPLFTNQVQPQLDKWGFLHLCPRVFQQPRQMVQQAEYPVA